MDRPNIVFIMPDQLRHAEIFHRLDTQLAHKIMRSANKAACAGRVCTFSHSSSPDFGRPGWERTYPMPWGEIYPD